jgi:hypothetical protein
MRIPLLAGTLLGLAAAAFAQPESAHSTQADQTDVAVTVYNSNRALVRDTRAFTLPLGEVALEFGDVAEQIMPQTVSLRSTSASGALAILEQNYEFDLMSQQKLMEKYVGKEVRLINRDKDYDFFEVNARLLSVNDGPVYEVDGEIYLGHPGTVVLPKIPDELIARPTLRWLLNNDAAEQTVEVAYLTGGISWAADYVITVNQAETELGLEGWVTLDNQSGATYTNAQLKLVAGDVNVVQQQKGMYADSMPMGAMAMRAAPEPMREEAFAEYHLYTLPRRTTVKQNQSKQVRLLTAQGVAVQKRYELRGPGHYYYQPIMGQEAPTENAGVYLVFDNREENKLGMPLPGGVMRVYQADSDGMLQFTGEDRIKHTPRNEEVKLQIGKAFDIVADRKQTDFQQIAQNVTESAYEIELRNRKKTPVLVALIETVPGDWKVLETTHEHTKSDAFTLRFDMEVPADGEVTVTYRVRIRS